MSDEPVSDSANAVFLRLFPLRLVLFPGMRLPLHVFEERYRIMIGECIEQKAPFGVVLIERGREVGGGASVHAIGTSARIMHVERYPDGRMNLVVVGEHRFRVYDFFQHDPYPAANVVYIPHSEPGSSETRYPSLERLVRVEWERYNRLMERIEENWETMDSHPSTPQELAYTVAASMLLDDAKKQELLEKNNLVSLLETESRLLAEQNYRHTAVIAARELLNDRIRRFGNFPKPFRLN
jgi:Lon protease-like protein